jgi:hypothetical protein
MASFLLTSGFCQFDAGKEKKIHREAIASSASNKEREAKGRN